MQGVGIYVALFSFLALTAYSTASLLGCPLNEGSANSCMLFTRDIGAQLYGEGLSFLYAFVGLPLWGALLFGAGIWWSRRLNKKDPSPMPKWTWRTLLVGGGFFVVAIFLVPIVNLPTTPERWWPQAQAYVVFNALPLIVSLWVMTRGYVERRAFLKTSRPQ